MASMASKESKSIYGNSSSRHNWMFETKEALNNVRENKIKKILYDLENNNNENGIGGMEVEEDGDKDNNKIIRKLKQEQMLLLHFERKLMELCQRMKVHETVEATAITYFKRFYLSKHSIFEVKYSPVIVSTTCLFIAGKTEEQRHELTVSKICDQVGLTKQVKTVLDMELEVLNTLSFQLRLYHPYASLRHLLRTFQTTRGNNMSDEVYKVFRADVYRILRLSFLTDCPFLFSPGQIAMASLELACTNESTQWASTYEKVYNDNFLNNVNFEDEKLRSVIELIKTEIISTKNILPPSKDVVVKVCSEIGIYLPNM